VKRVRSNVPIRYRFWHKRVPRISFERHLPLAQAALPEMYNVYVRSPWLTRRVRHSQPRHHVCVDAVGTVKLAFEVVGVEAVNTLAPYSTRYGCNTRADLDV